MNTQVALSPRNNLDLRYTPSAPFEIIAKDTQANVDTSSFREQIKESELEKLPSIPSRASV